MAQNNNRRKGNGGHQNRQETKIDFDPQARVDAAVRGRPRAGGVTIDPRGTYIMDDAVWVRRRGDGWTINVHVADLPSIIPPGSALEQFAQARKTETPDNEGVVRIFPGDFLDRFVSLHQGQLRPAVSFEMNVTDDGDIKSHKILRTAFVSEGRGNDRAFSSLPQFTPRRVRDWQRCAHDLFQNRTRRIAAEYDRDIDPSAPVLSGNPVTGMNGGMGEGLLLVHEVTRMTNCLATRFFMDNDLLAPVREQKARINISTVTPDLMFDTTCNTLCTKLVDKIESGRDPYIHLTSPMRDYRDYLALKIMGRALDGLPPDPALRTEVFKLSARFNSHAMSAKNPMSGPRWEGEWHQRLQRQNGSDILDRTARSMRGIGAAAELDALCRNRSFPRPRIAVRQIQVHGVEVYFAGMAFHDPGYRGGFDRHGWAVSHTPEQAVDTASVRVLKLVAV